MIYRCEVCIFPLLKFRVCVFLLLFQEWGDGEVVYEGVLSKKGRFNRGWKARHFKLLALRDGDVQVCWNAAAMRVRGGGGGV